MVGKLRWLSAAVVLSCVSIAGAQITIDFEGGYSVGALDGQQGWVLEDPATDGIAEVISGQNGPSLGGAKCVQMTEPSDANDVAVLLKKEIDNLMPWFPGGDGIVTLQYDIRWTNGQPNNSGLNVRCRIYDSLSSPARGIHPAHWWGLDTQFYGSVNPSGDPHGWVGNLDDTARSFGNGDSDWHTWKWVVYIGTGTGAAVGQHLIMEVDGEVIYRFDSFMPHNVTMLDLLRLMLYGTDNGWNPPADRDVVQFDNIIITSTPGTPSDIPVADAGPDITIPGGSVGGVIELDGTNSVDDGSIVKYRWLNLDASDYYARTLAYSTNGRATITLPNNSTMNVRMEVVDNDGLQSWDDLVVTVGDWDPSAVTNDNVAVPFGIKGGDIAGTSQTDPTRPTHVLPPNNGNVAFQVVNQRTTFADDPTGDRQLVFDEASNFYYIHWNGSLVSRRPDLNDRWQTNDIIGTTGENNQIVVGERYVYVVGAEQGSNIGTVFAFDKADGSIPAAWLPHIAIDGVNLTPDGGSTYPAWDANENARALMTLYNDKLYILAPVARTSGLPDTAYVYQIDSQTGTIEWASPIIIGMEQSTPGRLAFAPDFYGAGEHAMFFAGHSETEIDGLSDFNAVRITATGATLEWGIDDGKHYTSSPIWSDATQTVYSAGTWDWAGKQFWMFDPYDGYVKSDEYYGDDPNHPIAYGVRGGSWAEGYNLRSAALSYDGHSVFAPGRQGHIYKYTDNTDPGTPDTPVVDVDVYWVGGNEWYNGQPHAIMFQNCDGEENLLTAFCDPRWWPPVPEDPADNERYNAYIALIDVSNPPEQGDEYQVDDGPIYIDNVDVNVDGSSVYAENFETWTVGEFFPQATAKGWAWAGTPGTEDTAQIVDLGSPRGKVLRLDPFGGYSGDETAVKVTLPGGPYGGSPYIQNVEVSWYQLREDLTDKVYIGEDSWPAASSFQGDGSEADFPVGLICGFNTDADKKDGVTAQLADPNTPTWQEMQLDMYYAWDLVQVWSGPIGGPLSNDSGAPYFGPPGDGSAIDTPLDELKFSITASPLTSSGYIVTPEAPIAVYQTSDYLGTPDPSDPDSWERNWGEADALSVAPNGDIYYMQFKNYDRRWTRLRIVGDTCGPELCPGDLNCDGVVNYSDIDPFVAALSCVGGAPGCWPPAGFPADCPWLNGDCNGDGNVTYADIDPFVGRIGATCP